MGHMKLIAHSQCSSLGRVSQCPPVGSCSESLSDMRSGETSESHTGDRRSSETSESRSLAWSWSLGVLPLEEGVSVVLLRL